MGVSGLLPFLKKCSRRINIKDFVGYTVAVDAYCWIHRASYSCAMDIALGNTTLHYVNYCLKYLKMIIAAGVRPILVFDGANLPAKADTDAKRQRTKKDYREKAAQYLLEGNRKAAQECFERCVEVTAEMARNVIKAVRNLGVDCIVAPYESDAQLAYLVQSGYADLVITEDSDLLLFGCKQIIFKLDLTGFGVLITWSAGISEQCCGIPSQDFSPANLRFMGILSGCDYFPGIPRIGLATAAKIMRQCRTNDFRYLLSNLGNFCKLTGSACQPIGSLHNFYSSRFLNVFKESVSPSLLTSTSKSKSCYSFTNRNSLDEKQKVGDNRLHEDTIRAAMCAERTFRLQVVFDPKTRKRLRLSEPTMEDIREERMGLLDADLPDNILFFYAGDETLDSKLAFALALGNVDFKTGDKVDSFDPNDFKLKKLFNGAKEEVSDSGSAEIAIPAKSLLKKVNRPDGKRLNVSVWNIKYDLEPVWLYFSETGTRPRPFCISMEANGGNSRQLTLPPLEDKGDGMETGVRMNIRLSPTNSRQRLSSLDRDYRTITPSVLTAEPAVLNSRKRLLNESFNTDAVAIQDVLASYDSVNNNASSCKPLRTPIISANSYFASPVSTSVLTDSKESTVNNPNSPIFQSKRSRSLFTSKAEFISRTSDHVSLFANKNANASVTCNSQVISPRSKNSALSTINKFVFKQTPEPGDSKMLNMVGVKSVNPWSSARKTTALMKQSSNRQQLQQLHPDVAITGHKENEPPCSPVYDDRTVGSKHTDNAEVEDGDSTQFKSNPSRTGLSLSSFFRKWQFHPSKRNSMT